VTIDPSNLTILHYPAGVLRKKAKPLADISPEVRSIASRMIEMMAEAEGVGLAAPQVGIPWRLFVAHVPATEGRSPESDPPTATTAPTVYINPVISQHTGGLEPGDEGCLSLPDIRGEVLRPPIVTITATGLDGRSFVQTGAGLLARCWQHELDHLDGVLIIDRMTPMSRLKNRSAVRDLERVGDWSDEPPERPQR
jgi:peptide deformylase